MDQLTKELITGFKAYYAEKSDKVPPRLPASLKSEEDTFCRLAALYELEVEGRERLFIADAETISHIEIVARWLFHSKKRGLLFMGSLGNGKTTMLRAISRFFSSCPPVGDAQTIYDHYKQQQGSMRYWDEKMLLIDDLGIEPERCLIFGEEHYPLTKLLLHRYDRCLTTIIATNLGMNDIQIRYGDRVVDRLHETYEVIPYINDSYRHR